MWGMVRSVAKMCVMLATVGVLSGSVATSAVAEAPGTVGRYSTVESAAPLSTTNTYLMTMRGLLVGQERSDQTDAELIASGRAVCANEVADGMTWASLDVMLREADLNVPFYRAYVQTAVATFCPGEM